MFRWVVLIIGMRLIIVFFWIVVLTAVVTRKVLVFLAVTLLGFVERIPRNSAFIGGTQGIELAQIRNHSTKSFKFTLCQIFAIPTPTERTRILKDKPSVPIALPLPH